MTEDEAKQRWCPFASSRVVSWKKSPVELVNAVQAVADGHAPTTTCIASDCMAWRWRGWFLEEDRNVHATPPPTDQSVRLGYCGLARPPQ